ncbi:hypothetical protein STEG23_003096 [Scotinomys teguina]
MLFALLLSVGKEGPISLLPPGTLDVIAFYFIKCIRIEIICYSTTVEESGIQKDECRETEEEADQLTRKG